MKTRAMFMHTLNGRPAGWDGEQVVFADVMPHWQDVPSPVHAYPELSTVKAQILASQRWRKRKGFANDAEYGWCVVEVPA